MKYNFHLETITCDPSIYTMDHPVVYLSNQKEESISAKRVNPYSHFHKKWYHREQFSNNNFKLLKFSNIVLNFLSSKLTNNTKNILLFIINAKNRYYNYVFVKGNLTLFFLGCDLTTKPIQAGSTGISSWGQLQKCITIPSLISSLFVIYLLS